MLLKTTWLKIKIAINHNQRKDSVFLLTPTLAPFFSANYT